jgi:ABC-type amino acid transport system permease subunit
MDRIIEPLASGLGNGIGWLADHGVLFAAFAALWVAFGAALILSQGSLDQAWVTIRGLPLIVQIVVWVLFLPVMAGLWVWETTWRLGRRLEPAGLPAARATDGQALTCERMRCE